MRRPSLGFACYVVLMIVALGCSPAERERADQKTAQAEAKLKQGTAELRDAGAKAGVKLDQASLIAKVKAKLANDVGLSTATAVEVDARGRVVTLRGTVASEDQKQRAERAARQVDGVTTVLNELRVTPK
jgi:osmotically-inducible protein OsmY